jgi:hypothetical protein
LTTPPLRETPAAVFPLAVDAAGTLIALDASSTSLSALR